jgi:hypothetical protein
VSDASGGNELRSHDGSAAADATTYEAGDPATYGAGDGDEACAGTAYEVAVRPKRRVVRRATMRDGVRMSRRLPGPRDS